MARSEQFSPQELQVLERVGGGSTVPEVAEALAISERTATNHVRSIVTKLTVLLQERHVEE